MGFFSAIGTDFAGERLMRALTEEGISADAVARVDAPTTLSLVGVDRHGLPSYAFHGHGAADRLVRPEHLAAIPARAKAAYAREKPSLNGSATWSVKASGAAPVPPSPPSICT